MLFNKETKQAFVLPPRCATNTTVGFLSLCGWHLSDEKHATTDSLIEKYPNLAQYQIYGFLRDPLKRLESAFLYLKQFPYTRLNFDAFLESQNAPNRELVSYDEMIDLLPLIREKFHILLRPQSDWLAHPQVTVLDFDNFESELRRVVGNTDQPMVQYNVSEEFGKSVITEKMRAYAKTEYAVDYALAKERLGKEYP